jgi:hypothetical protein
MTTLNIQKKRKNIDIPINTFRCLSIKAAANGKSLKSFIECLLIKEANVANDNELYKYLLDTKPEGNVYLDETKQKEFEDWLEL